MDASRRAINDLCHEWQSFKYERGRHDCVQFVLAYMDKLGVKREPVQYHPREKLSARKVIKVLGKPLPDGVEGDVVLSEQVLALNPKNGKYFITMVSRKMRDEEHGGLALAVVGESEKKLQWQLAEQ